MAVDGAAPGMAAAGAPGGVKARKVETERGEPRWNVFWPGRVALSATVMFELRIRNVSKSGFGMLLDVRLDDGAVLPFAICHPGEPGAQRAVLVGKARVVHCVLQGASFIAGAVWTEVDSSARDALMRAANPG